MRPNSQNNQISISWTRRTPSGPRRRLRTATVALMALLSIAIAPPAWSDVETDPDLGRRTQTGPKQPQVSLDGVNIVNNEPAPRESGYAMTKRGRKLRARPTQPVVVGHVGCVGCREMLRSLGGVFLDVGGRGRNGRGR